MTFRSMQDINEAAADSIANAYSEKYSDQVDAYLSGSALARIQESVSPYEIMALGQQLDQFSNYKQFCESQGQLASLGAVPQIALDVITASVGGSILPLVASIQPMAEEHGIVYYKQIKAAQAGGGYTAGQVIRDPLTLDVPGDGTLGSQRKMQSLFTSVDTDLNYTGNLTSVPIRPYMLELNVPGVGTGKDDGKGKILGFGFSGTINYETGAYVIDFAANPGAGKVCSALYDVDIDAAASIDKIQGGLITKDIRAQIWALAADVGAFANFAFGQRFGRSATDEVAADLTNEITNILNVNAIKNIYTNLVGNTNWSKTPDSGVSYAEHKLTFVDQLAVAESVLHLNSGAGNINRIIAGRSAAATLRGLPDFTPAAESPVTTVGLFGTLDGVPVIRATNIIPDNEMILLSNPQNYFNAPLAYSPFMPLMITNTVQSPNNPFRQTQAAGVWSGMTHLNGNLATKLTVTA